MKIFANIFDNSIAYLFPKQCVLCSTTGDYMCKDCKRELKAHPEMCPYCHKFSQDYKTCLDCKSSGTSFGKAALEGIIIAFVYSDSIKKLILKLKYFHKKNIAEFLSQRLQLVLQINQSLQRQLTKTMQENIYVSGVPSHRFRKYFVKGYNQSEILAKNFSKELGFTYIKIAKKKKHTKSQAGLNRKNRLTNLKNCFQLEAGFQPKEKSVLILIDDITTSGATLDELASIVKQKHPGIKIWSIVVGRSAG